MQPRVSGTSVRSSSSIDMQCDDWRAESEVETMLVRKELTDAVSVSCSW